jgi:drug/metabolite transporter (DMT)-like permease
MVTYFIPIISTLWGLADNEILTPSMFISIAVILTGVYIINRAALKRYIWSKNE